MLDNLMTVQFSFSEKQHILFIKETDVQKKIKKKKDRTELFLCLQKFLIVICAFQSLKSASDKESAYRHLSLSRQVENRALISTKKLEIC